MAIGLTGGDSSLTEPTAGRFSVLLPLDSRPAEHQLDFVPPAQMIAMKYQIESISKESTAQRLAHSNAHGWVTLETTREKEEINSSFLLFGYR